ncbi:MAG: S-methyl-5-thioribose-1-phosphate isomerase [Spartobacteria bacterium]|nr:S-methyl-5-thioribose-1-phosphate isomerase [Spartobacteria bacterium]
MSKKEHSPLPGTIRMVDQTRLPEELVFLETSDIQEIWAAIKVLKVRGAPAIGVAAAMGLVAGIQEFDAPATAALLDQVDEVADYLASSRPTAVNLFWALNRMKRTARANAALAPTALKERLAKEAMAIRDEDAAMCRAIGEHGVTLLKPGQTILTHCNAGGLATAEWGTALAPVYVAQERGMDVKVFSDETRPLLQGSRLTAWELGQAGIDVTVICDNMAAKVMQEGRIDAVMVGADRIAANGDAANKIGTYGVAVLAHAHHIPFYVLAPTSTLDLSLDHGDKIPIEERGRDEVINGFGRLTAPENAQVYSPAFDVTPARLITAIITEQGIARPPFEETFRAWIPSGEA